MNLSDRLKIARESIGKSQKEIADLVHVSYRAWQGYETGENVPGGKVFEALARMGFNVNWLFTGEGGIKTGMDVVEPKNNLESANKAMAAKSGQTSVAQMLSDDELIYLIYEAVDEVASEWGNDETVFSSKEKANIAKELFRIFSPQDSRQYVTKETMAEQTVILFLISCNRDKVNKLINKLGIKPSDNLFHTIKMFHHLAEVVKNE